MNTQRAECDAGCGADDECTYLPQTSESFVVPAELRQDHGRVEVAFGHVSPILFSTFKAAGIGYGGQRTSDRGQGVGGRGQGTGDAGGGRG